MGIILSLLGVSGWKTEEQEEDEDQRIKPRKTSGPLLPLANQTPKPSDHHPLKQPLLISNSNADSQCQNIHVFSCQCLEQNQEYSSETKNTKDHVTISIPSFSTHVLDAYSTSSITDTDSAVNTQENAPRKIVSYAEHEETGIYISTDQTCEESGDRCLEQKRMSHTQNRRSRKSRDKKNESYAEHEEPGICISTEKKCKESSKVKEIKGKKVRQSTVVVEKPRWIRHYSSRHRILLVGEGDFSFSCSLAVAFGRASKMVATSLDSQEFLKKNYAKAQWNIGELKKRGCMVVHGIDATTIATQQLLQHKTFDRIIYNFPFAGFFKGLSRDSTLRRHRRLVSLFLKNAKEMIDENGEIHISHKTNEYHNEWKLVSIASSHGLRLIEEVEFDLSDYPGYNTKRGFGGDSNFNCYPSNTFKFGLKFVGH